MSIWQVSKSRVMSQQTETVYVEAESEQEAKDKFEQTDPAWEETKVDYEIICAFDPNDIPF